MKPKSYTRFEIDNQKTKSEFKFCKNQKHKLDIENKVDPEVFGQNLNRT